MRSEVVPVADVDRERLFALYELYYEGAERTRFFEDLDEKDCVIVLIDDNGGADGLVRPPRDSAASASPIVGFSTQKVFALDHVRVLFSGDTIIDPRHWGTQEL